MMNLLALLFKIVCIVGSATLLWFGVVMPCFSMYVAMAHYGAATVEVSYPFYLPLLVNAIGAAGMATLAFCTQRIEAFFLTMLHTAHHAMTHPKAPPASPTVSQLAELIRQAKVETDLRLHQAAVERNMLDNLAAELKTIAPTIGKPNAPPIPPTAS